MPKKKKYRRTKTVHKSFVPENDIDKHFVSTEQVDKACDYLLDRKNKRKTKPFPLICIGSKNMSENNKKVLARIKMPKLPDHYPRKVEPTNIGRKNRLTSLFSLIGL